MQHESDDEGFSLVRKATGYDYGRFRGNALDPFGSEDPIHFIDDGSLLTYRDAARGVIARRLHHCMRANRMTMGLLRACKNRAFWLRHPYAGFTERKLQELKQIRQSRHQWARQHIHNAPNSKL